MNSIFLALYNTDAAGKPVEVAAPGYARQPLTLTPSEEHEGYYTNTEGVDFTIPGEGWGIITSAGIISANGDVLHIFDLTTPRDTKPASNLPASWKLGGPLYLSLYPGNILVPAEDVSSKLGIPVPPASGSTVRDADLIEALCHNLAVQTVSNAITLQCMSGDIDHDLQKAVDEAPTLIKAAGHDMDTLFPVADRPMAIIPDEAEDGPTPCTPIAALQPTTLITTANDEKVAAALYWMDEDNLWADIGMAAAAHGMSILPLYMSNDPDAPEELFTRHDTGENVLADWNPSPPSPAHQLAGKFDTEDGPIAWFIAPLTSTARDAIRKAFAQALKTEG